MAALAAPFRSPVARRAAACRLCPAGPGPTGPAGHDNTREDTMSTTAAAPDFATVKQRQQATWAAGDYAVVGTTLQIVGERLCEAIDLRAGERVLDVAAGNGNATLAAARRFAEVTSTDYVGALLDRARARAEAERLPVLFRAADPDDLPFVDSAFDV